MGATRIERIRNECLKGLAQAGQFRDKVREVRLSRHGHVQVRDTGCTGRRMAKMELRGKRETKCRCDEREHAGGWSDFERCKDANDSRRWKQIIRCVSLKSGQQ